MKGSFVHNELQTSFFIENRQALMKVLGKKLLVVPAHAKLQKSADTSYMFRQDSNFWYLTGIDEPDLVLVLDGSTGDEYLLVPDQNAYQKEWEGKQDVGVFSRLCGIRTVLSRSHLDDLVTGAVKKDIKIAVLKPLPDRLEPYGFYTNPSRKIIRQSITKVTDDLYDARADIALLRQVKRAEEIALIQSAVTITGLSLASVKKKYAAMSNEKEVERALSAEFYSHGSDGHAYDPIVASGKNAAIIHYDKNADALRSDGFILLDVGAQVGHYAADISRVWHSGTPTVKQMAYYNEALELQQIAYTLLKPGVSIKEYQSLMETHAAKSFKKLGIATETYPHGFSHYLGIDVHDAGDYSAPLEPGVVLTVEPGIYNDKEGIGVRIEDDVVITDKGIRVLSAEIPLAY